MLNNEDNLKAYEKIARIYAGEEPHQDDPELRDNCRQFFADNLTGKDVLEIGCGPGVDAYYLTKMGLNVTATDFAPEFVKIVKERFPDITAVQMDMTDPTFPDESFDGIYGFASFVHLPRKLGLEALPKLNKLLRPGGAMFLFILKSSKVEQSLF